MVFFPGVICQQNFAWSDLRMTIWYAYGSLLRSYSSRHVHSEHGPGVRTVLAMWMIFCFFASLAYSENLKAHLTDPAFESPINTPEDVMKTGLPIWYVDYQAEVVENAIASAKDPVLDKIWLNKKLVHYDKDNKLLPIYQGKGIFINSKLNFDLEVFLEYTTPKGEKLVHISPDPIWMNAYIAFGFRKSTPIQDEVNRIILNLIETGWVERYIYESLVYANKKMGKQRTEDQEQEVIHPLTMSDLTEVFVILLLMLLGSILTLFLEILHKIATKKIRSSKYVI